jgi:hypothetical protein
MIEVDLASARRARLWLGDLPDVAFDPDDVLVSTPVSALSLRPPIASCAAEVLFSAGPWQYGLLGGSFVRDNTASFRAEVLVCEPSIESLPWSLARGGDARLSRGLPGWAGEAVAGVLSFPGNDDRELPSGTLTLTHAVNSETLSSVVAFEVVAQIMLELLSEDSGRLTPSRLPEIVRSGFRRALARR